MPGDRRPGSVFSDVPKPRPIAQAALPSPVSPTLPANWWSLRLDELAKQHHLTPGEWPCLLNYEFSRSHRGVLNQVAQLRGLVVPPCQEGDTRESVPVAYRIAEFWVARYPEFPQLAYWEIEKAVRQARLTHAGIDLHADPYLPPPVVSHDPSIFAENCARGIIPWDDKSMTRYCYVVLQFDPFQPARKVDKQLRKLLADRRAQVLQQFRNCPETEARVRKNHGETRGKHWNRAVINAAVKELGAMRLLGEFNWNWCLASEFLRKKEALPYQRLQVHWERAAARGCSLLERFERVWRFMNYPILPDATADAEGFFYRCLLGPMETQAAAYRRKATLFATVGRILARSPK